MGICEFSTVGERMQENKFNLNIDQYFRVLKI